MTLALVLAAVLCGAASAQPAPAPQSPPPPGDLPVFRAETSLALVRFHVVNKTKKQYVVDLKPEQIELLEDGRPQKIALFEGPGNGAQSPGGASGAGPGPGGAGPGSGGNRSVPVEIILVFDTSGSVLQEGLLDPVVFKRDLLDSIPNAYLSVYRFETRMRRLAQRTRDLETIRKAFSALDKRVNFGTVLKLEQHASEKDRKHGIGGSPIFEAVMEAARDASAGPSDMTRQLVIFSDGFATSGTKPAAAARLAQELGIPVSPVVLGHGRIIERLQRGVQQQMGDVRGGQREPSADMRRAQSQQQEIEEFASLGELTGGRAFDPRYFTADSLRQMLRFMVGQVRNEYVAGYYPASGEGGKKSYKLSVRLRSKDYGKLLGGTRVMTR
jgi:VWFA-related protein